VESTVNLFSWLEPLGMNPWSSVTPRPVLAGSKSEIPGLRVVGDLGDAPVLKMAMAQGRQAALEMVQELRALGPASADVLDVVVLGAGPAGVAAAEVFHAAGLRYAVIEKGRPFETLHAFPKGKPIFAEPAQMGNPTGLWLQDAPKEELIERWSRFLVEGGLFVHAGEEVVGVARTGDGLLVRTRVGPDGRDVRYPTAAVPGMGSPGSKNEYLARRVLVAVGKRGSVRRLGVPGDDREKVRHALADPASYAGRDVLVVGGGDSAVEAAIAVAYAGGRVALSYRQTELSRPKRRNREQFEALVADGRIRFLASTVPSRIGEHDVELRGPNGTVVVPNDDVLVFIGATAPRDLLRSMGIRLEGDFRLDKAAWVLGFAALTWCFYVLKRKAGYFPFGTDDPLGFVPGLLQVDLGFRSVDAGFWGTLIYSALIVGFGIWALRRYGHDPVQRNRYVSLMSFQAVFLFGIPELVIPGLHAVVAGIDGVAGSWLDVLLSRGWKFYALSVPWPLSLWSVVESPAWVAGSSPIDSRHVVTAVAWTGLGLLTSFVVVPLYVWRNNERFCSWMCGCGGLAETFGDAWRHLAPRGVGSQRLEWAGFVILFMAVPTSLLLVADAWQVLSPGFFLDAKTFAQGWYDLMVDFMLASVVGVAMYPVLGNRVWCRFFCPLRAYMQILARWFGRLQIQSTDACISCGACTRACQMGIEVQRFAELQRPLDNTNSVCIQCGICVHVCPMDVLSLGPVRADGGREIQVQLA
jgi:thioredoxin reductase/ferredoxin